MKATIETVTGVTINRDIDTADSPMGILRKFYEEDATAATQIFSNQRAIDQLMSGNVDESKSSFDLISLDGDSIKADWKTPLCNQPAIKEEMARIESEGQVPTFVVSVSSIVAATKAVLETVTGVSINRDIDTADSPMAILRKFYEEDATAATQIFSNQKAIDQLMAGNIDEAKSAFELISLEGDSIRADWKTALCNQPAIKEEMARIESEGQVPTFVVSVSSIVAGC